MGRRWWMGVSEARPDGGAAVAGSPMTCLCRSGGNKGAWSTSSGRCRSSRCWSSSGRGAPHPLLPRRSARPLRSWCRSWPRPSRSDLPTRRPKAPAAWLPWLVVAVILGGLFFKKAVSVPAQAAPVAEVPARARRRAEHRRRSAHLFSLLAAPFGAQTAGFAAGLATACAIAGRTGMGWLLGGRPRTGVSPRRATTASNSSARLCCCSRAGRTRRSCCSASRCSASGWATPRRCRC